MLTNEQVAELFRFCEKHHVHFYDVQVELVDHLANAIEEKMQTGSDFENALGEVYAGFGAMGFAGFANSRSRLMEKQYSKLKSKLFWSYFTWPKAAMTACLLLLFSSPYRFLNGEGLSIFTSVLVAGVMIYEVILLWMLKKEQKKPNKPLMITAARYEISYVAMFICFQFTVTKNFDVIKKPTASFIVFELIVVFSLLVLLSVFAWRDTLRKLYSRALEQYPGAFV